MQAHNKDNFNTATNPVTDNVYFKTLAESTSNLVILADPNDYSVQYISRLSGNIPLENIIGTSMFNFIISENIQIFKDKIDEAKLTKKSIAIEFGGTSTRDSNRIDWYSSRISVILNNDESIKNIMLTVENVTETKLNEIEVRNKSEKIKSIINNTNDIICSIDNAYNLTEYNSMFQQMVKMGYNLDLELGMPVLNFIDPKTHNHLLGIYKKVQTGDRHTDIQSFNTKNGHTVYNETNYNPIYNINKEIIGINIFSKDITERMKVEQSIKNALKEKEVLLAEIHHRIKNNLAIVSSLLQLQEMNISNLEAKEALGVSRKRIKSTALIHELLYRNESFQNISLKEYLTELFNLLKLNENIQLKLEGEDLFFNINIALPLGLMLNEIMLNSFKHSYKDANEGQTLISLFLENNTATISYCDCKGSFPEAVDFKNSSTTGLTLIHTFADQINGNVELINHTPPKYKIQFPINENH